MVWMSLLIQLTQSNVGPFTKLCKFIRWWWSCYLKIAITWSIYWVKLWKILWNYQMKCSCAAICPISNVLKISIFYESKQIYVPITGLKSWLIMFLHTYVLLLPNYKTCFGSFDMLHQMWGTAAFFQISICTKLQP